MFPLLDRERPNPVELFQIWLNLPAEDKLVDPHFTMLWDRDIPRHRVSTDGRSTEVTVIAGVLGGRQGPPPPPRSWASRPESDVAIWHIRMDAGARWVLPAAGGPDTVRTLYVFEGGSLRVGVQDIAAPTAAVVHADVAIELVAGVTGVECLLLQGRPIGQPVAQYGPFVMNNRREIEEAFADYQRTGFGGWPWNDDGPVHGVSEGRFARHADGRIDRVDAVSA